MKILYFFLFSFLFIACSTPVINKNDVVAEVNGEQILLSELASQSKQEIFDILNTAYEIKSRVLAGLIKQKLLEDAAKKENMSLEEFIDWFVQQKICVGQDSLKKRYGFNTQSFYVKGELIPLVKGSFGVGLFRHWLILYIKRRILKDFYILQNSRNVL